VTSTRQKAVLRVVLYLAGINGALAAALIAYAWAIHLPLAEIIPLALIAILASNPVALPATFTLATAIGAQALGKRGGLPTRLSAVDEAASMNVLSVDKTGTLTSSGLAVAAVAPVNEHSEADVLMWAQLASSDGGLDPVDAAVRNAAARFSFAKMLQRKQFVPFDPRVKMAEATVVDAAGGTRHVVKGAFAYITALAQTSPAANAKTAELEAEGFRALGVALSTPGLATPGELQVIGLLALSDPPRPEAAGCVAMLRSMGVDVVMVTGDAPATAGAVARAIGLNGTVASAAAIPRAAKANDLAVFAGVLPRTNTPWSKPSRSRAIRSACAATGPTMRLRCGRPSTALRSRLQPTSRNRRPALCSANLALQASSAQSPKGASPSSASHIALDRAQGPPGHLSRGRTSDHRSCHPDTDAGRDFHDHRRFSCDVFDHGQRAAVRTTQYVEDREPHDRRRFLGSSISPSASACA
jgi:magnesium-transporting ATPase (P-type)